MELGGHAGHLVSFTMLWPTDLQGCCGYGQTCQWAVNVGWRWKQAQGICSGWPQLNCAIPEMKTKLLCYKPLRCKQFNRESKATSSCLPSYGGTLWRVMGKGHELCPQPLLLSCFWTSWWRDPRRFSGGNIKCLSPSQCTQSLLICLYSYGLFAFQLLLVSVVI